MNKEYYNATVAMEKAGVNEDYIIGWQCGYVLNPPREEQRVTPAYEAGYAKGKAREMGGFEEWVNK
jgi:hypothetical protein